MSVFRKLGAGAVIAGAAAALKAWRTGEPDAAPDPPPVEAPTDVEAPEQAASPAPTADAEPESTAGGDRIDLNTADFEQLRALKLSITQANRVIAVREERGGFGSLNELDEIQGLSMTTRAELRERLRL